MASLSNAEAVHDQRRNVLVGVSFFMAHALVSGLWRWECGGVQTTKCQQVIRAYVITGRTLGTPEPAPPAPGHRIRADPPSFCGACASFFAPLAHARAVQGFLRGSRCGGGRPAPRAAEEPSAPPEAGAEGPQQREGPSHDGDRTEPGTQDQTDLAAQTSSIVAEGAGDLPRAADVVPEPARPQAAPMAALDSLLVAAALSSDEEASDGVPAGRAPFADEAGPAEPGRRVSHASWAPALEDGCRGVGPAAGAPCALDRVRTILDQLPSGSWSAQDPGAAALPDPSAWPGAAGANAGHATDGFAAWEGDCPLQALPQPRSRRVSAADGAGAVGRRLGVRNRQRLARRQPVLAAPTALQPACLHGMRGGYRSGRRAPVRPRQCRCRLLRARIRSSPPLPAGR